MFSRVMASAVVLGCCALGVFLLLQRYTAPACGANVTTSQLVPQISAKTGLSGLYLFDVQSLSGGLLSRTRDCVVDVAQIEGLQTLGAAHWLKVIYSASIDRPTGTVTVRSQVAGPVTPVFAPNPST
jgi:hypothetical protein